MVKTDSVENSEE
jgi:hypothetical protein